MDFINEMKKVLNEDYNVSVTENGAIGYATSGKKLLDINFKVSSFRNAPEKEIEDVFIDAFYENKMLAVKWLFFARDVRGGLGERRLFRVCMKYLIREHKEIAVTVCRLIPEYGRWDDLFCLLDTDLKQEVINIVDEQFKKDCIGMNNNESISLCAKWAPSINASSKETKRLARILCNGLNIKEEKYRKTLSTFRSYLKVVEVDMTANNWDKIDYAAVPSKANLLYNGAFLRNDEERRREYLSKLSKGEAKINAGVLYPHDIVHSYDTPEWSCWSNWDRLKKLDTTLEELWKALPDYVDENSSTICVTDGSGSMMTTVGNTAVTCLDVANALAIYFSERCSGAFKDKYITFSRRPKLIDFTEATTLREKICMALKHNEIANTNIEAVFDLILDTAVHNGMTQAEMPQNVLILSDMEFDRCAEANGKDSINPNLFKVIENKYKEHGYQLPRLVFWNICNGTGTIPVRENDLGVALVSGFSPSIVKMVLSNSVGPLECLLEQFNTERYQPVEDALKSVK